MIEVSLGVRTSATAVGAAVEIIAPAAAALTITEINFANVAATAGVLGLGRPAAKGVDPTTPAALLAQNPRQVPLGQAAVAWTTTAPTVPAAFFRRTPLAAAVGADGIWLFPKGLLIEPNATLVLWIIATSSVLDVNISGFIPG